MMIRNEPLVSVLIPAFNHENYLDDTMKSILAQSYNNLEIIITDDCSTDNTYMKLKQWEETLKKRFERVQIFRNERNKGISKTLNHMLNICKGKYIKGVASDDFLLPHAIKKLVNYMEENPKCGLVFANGVMGDERTHYPLPDTHSYKAYYTHTPEFKENTVEKLYCQDFILAPSIMHTNKIYQMIGGYDEDMWAEDWDFYLRIAERMTIGYLDDVVVMYRILKTSASHSTKLENRMGMRKSELLVLLKHKEFVDNKLGDRIIYNKCNDVFKEAFDMRSKIYVDAIHSLMKERRIKKDIRNKFLSMLYHLHLVDFLFS